MLSTIVVWVETLADARISDSRFSRAAGEENYILKVRVASPATL